MIKPMPNLPEGMEWTDESDCGLFWLVYSDAGEIVAEIYETDYGFRWHHHVSDNRRVFDNWDEAIRDLMKEIEREHVRKQEVP